MSESVNTFTPYNVKKSAYENAKELLLKESSHLAIPLTTSALGYNIGGLYGAMLGLGIGTLDETLYQYGYTEQRYLSAMFIGAGMLVSPQKTLMENALPAGLGASLALTL